MELCFYIALDANNNPIQSGCCQLDLVDLQCPDAVRTLITEKHYNINDVYIDNDMVIEKPLRPSDCYDWIGNEWVVNIDKVRSGLKKSVDNARDDFIICPILYNGVLWDADSRAISNLTIWKGAILPDGFVWRDYNNESHLIESSFIVDLLYAIAVRGTYLYKQSWVKKAEIDSLGLDDLLVYDSSSNW